MPTPTLINTLIRESLSDALSILYPASPELDNLVKRHRWSTRSDVGELNGKVVSWVGWSVNLRLANSEYRTVYFDLVPNILPEKEKIEIFGSEFTSVTDGLDEFLVVFNTSYPVDAVDTIRASGFVARPLGKIYHACKVINPDGFAAMPSLFWAAYAVKLVRLQWQILHNVESLEVGTPESSGKTIDITLDDLDLLDP